MQLKELIMSLCSISGPSGYETKVREYLYEYFSAFTQDIHTDALGNLWAIHRCGIPDAPLLMLDAHMDEIGLVVTSVEDGFLRFAPLGGVDARLLPAREVRIMTDPPLFGVIDTMPVHILKDGEEDTAIETDKLCIDIGMSRENAEKAVPLGTPVVFTGGCTELGDDCLCGKALDDRACVAILLSAFERLCAIERMTDICCLISTQEELGCRGATTATWSIHPDYAIAVDVTHAKTPDAKEVLTDAGKGAAIGVGPNMNAAFTKLLFAAAERNGIPYQTEVCPGESGTNAEVIQISGCGVATALVSLPEKYMHTPCETARLEDAQAVCDLLVAVAAEMEA